MSETFVPLKTYQLGSPPTADGWLVSDWDAGQSAITAWSPLNVRTAADGSTLMVLEAAPAGAPRPVLGAEIQSDATLTLGTFGWTAEVPDMVDGAVFGMFAYQADWQGDPWLEFDLEFVGGGTTQVELAVHMEDSAGRPVSNLHGTVVDLGFDAAEGLHTYEVTLTGTGAVFRADGVVIAYFSAADMPGGVWNTGELRSMVDLWAADPRYASWTGPWAGPGTPLVATVAGAEVRPGDMGGAMPILGTSGGTVLRGTAGRDVIDGLAGNDTLVGDAGHDRMMGGAGDDTLYLDAGNDWLDGGGGSDRLLATGSAAVTLDLDNAWGSQATGMGTDSLRGIEHAQGGAGNDSVMGTAAGNSLGGADGSDWLDGRGGADTLVGGAGRDAMAGGADRDRDVFVLAQASHSAAGANRDSIQQFVSGIDDLDLRAIDANPGLAGDQAFAWGGTRAGANAVWVEVWGTSLCLKADVTGDGLADLEVLMIGITSMAAGDVLL